MSDGTRTDGSAQPSGQTHAGDQVGMDGQRMTEQRLAEFTAAWGRGDIEALMDFVTDDCVYAASVGPEPGTTYRGRAEVRRGFLEMLAHDADSVSRGGPVAVFGDRGTAEWSYLYTGPDGREVEVRGCDLFEFRGDKITRKDAFRKVHG